MDSTQHTIGLREVGRIQAEVRSTGSIDDLRYWFERVKSLRQTYADDFDESLALTDLQAEILERARVLRELPGEQKSFDDELHPPSSSRTSQPVQPALRAVRVEPERDPDAAEIPPDVERMDDKNWQRAVYIGIFFAVLLFAAFFYLVQTARRLNFPAEQKVAGTAAQPASTAASKPAATASEQTPATPVEETTPTLRLYTDLVPGTVTIDSKEPQDLKDGELNLDHLSPGQHSIHVAGRSGDASFTYDVSEHQAPHLVGMPVVNNAMAVLVASDNGKAHLVTNAENAAVTLDGKDIGPATADGLNLDDLNKDDHLVQVTDGHDRQRFVYTWTAAPTLTVYVKSDPNAGTAVIVTKQDGADVFINNQPYKRKTEAGQLRIPLRVGDYTIRVHKPGFLDPPPAMVNVRKAEESAVDFTMEPVPQIATLEVKGAPAGTMVFVDRELAAAIGNDGTANISNVKPGPHTIELRRDGAITKKFDRQFKTGELVALSGPDVALEKAVVESPTATDVPPPATASAPTAPATSATAEPNSGMQMDGEQVRKGGGFVAYHVPRVAGHYTFSGQARKGGFLKHGKLEWYAGYQDSQNYVLYSADGKHITVRSVRNGHAEDVNRVAFDSDPDTWLQVDMTVKPGTIETKVRTPDGSWQDLGSVKSQDEDFTKGKVGLHIADKDEIAVANFRFAAR